MTTLASSRQRAALSACEILLAPGKKWRLSPYLQAAIAATGDPSLRALVPVYQAIILDLLRDQLLPSSLIIATPGDSSGIAPLAVVDALLTWQIACVLHDIPTGVANVELSWSESSIGQAAHAAREAFIAALMARASEIPALAEINANIRRVLSAPTTSTSPNLVAIAFPWERPGEVRSFLHSSPNEGILAGVAWQRPLAETHVTTLMNWRYELLRQFAGLTALGPCGQEFSTQLPPACQTCFHGRRELMHSQASGGEEIASWNYVLVGKRNPNLEVHPPLTANDLGQPWVDEAWARYIGTVRQKVVVAEHPDRYNDNPADTTWREYLIVCPGHTSASAIAIERGAGTQTPRLRYGQWLHLRDTQSRRPFPADQSRYVLQVRNEADLARDDILPLGETFVRTYTPRVRDAVNEAAYRLFGFPSLRPFQHTIMERILCGHSLFSVAATGSGKSECYILPAMLLPGVTVVVSPLKSLILDQYEQRIRDRYGLDHLSTFINGDVGFYERQGRLRRIVQGYFKLVYVTPEQLERGYVLDALRQANKTVGVRYLALDEAHCISQWGHDFRPSYLNMVQRIEKHGLNPCRIALTATASPLVREDVCVELHLDPRELAAGGDVFIEAANRPELNLVVRRLDRTEEKARQIVASLRGLGDSGSAIVFMPHTGGSPDNPRDFGAPASDISLRNAGMVSPGVSPFAHYLSEQLGQPVAIYHGAMDDGIDAQGNGHVDDETPETRGATRVEEQRDFMCGRKRVMVATKGFGMGVDKPDIRLVIHRSPPANLEAYAQEAGRAGRDGRPATALLLYSEDRAEIRQVSDRHYISRQRLPSDKEIQQYFLDNRFVCREDVQAMMAFLRSERPREANGAIYFTNDQVMAFLDQGEGQGKSTGLSSPYTWPTFTPRHASSYESDDHRRIRDLGHVYSEKRKHIGRILAVLFNNRPTMGGKVLPLVNSAHETGTLLSRFRLYRPDRVIESLAYFGDRLRTAGIAEADLRRLLPDGERTDLTPLALRLGLSLRETASMLYDIRSCEGRYSTHGHEEWVGGLLHFSRIEAPRLVSLPDPYDLSTWRSYAGAFTRSKPAGDGRTLDDYFPWRTLNPPIGWEVEPGEGLSYPNASAYLDQFMRLHDQRRKNDQSNFAYLVERYIGASSHPPECLRSLLLGYLKTNEVVLGGTCYSCSVCVPDLSFQNYPMQKRREVIVRLMTQTSSLITRIEATNRQAPPSELVEQLLNAIRNENEAGRSGTAYLESWVARLLQDDPNHQGALWVRIEGYIQRAFQVSQDDLVTALERLMTAGTAHDQSARLWRVVQHILNCSDDTLREPALLALAAELAEQCQDWAQAARLWSETLARPGRGKSAARQAIVLRALRNLLLLHGSGGHLPDPDRAAELGLQLARGFDVTLAEAVSAYQPAVSRWSWQMLETELAAPAHASSAAFLAWLDTHGQKEAALAWLEAHGDKLRDWPLETLGALDRRLGSALDRLPSLLTVLADATSQRPDSIVEYARYVLRAWCAGGSLNQKHFKALIDNLTKLDERWCRTTIAACKNASVLLAALVETHNGKEFPLFVLSRFPPQVVHDLPEPLFGQLVATLSHNSKAKVDTDLWREVVRRITRETKAEWLMAISAAAQASPALATAAFDTWLADTTLTMSLAAPLFGSLLQDKTDLRHTGNVLDALSKHAAMVNSSGDVSACLDNWVALTDDPAVFGVLNRTETTGEDLRDLGKRWLAQPERLHRVEMFIVILRRIRARSSPNWLTPISWEVQALCVARRFGEAEAITQRYNDLTIAGREAQLFIAASSRGVEPRQYEANPLYEQILQVATGYTRPKTEHLEAPAAHTLRPPARQKTS